MVRDFIFAFWKYPEVQNTPGLLEEAVNSSVHKSISSATITMEFDSAIANDANVIPTIDYYNGDTQLL